MYCALAASPPCSTFSLSRSSGLPGRRPLRSRRWPRRFPWLASRALQSVTDANILVKFTDQAIRAQSATSNPYCPEASRRLGEMENRCRPSIYLAVECYQRAGTAGRGKDRGLETVRLGDRLPKANKVVGSMAWYRKDPDGRMADL